jgi:protein arginine kinase activator
MVCDNCHERDAVVNLTTIENNAVRQLHLCEQCAAERGVETTVAAPKHPLGEFLQAVQQQSVPASADAGKCSFCGHTMKDFRETGRLGCARCYSTFESSMRELLRRVHGGPRHIGRTYRAPKDEVLEKAGTLGELREKLRRAIEQEQFEAAAELRDRIRVLE